MQVFNSAYESFIKSQFIGYANAGFKKKGDSFIRKNEFYWQIVNWQKSKDSTKDVIKFTLNIGVHSVVLSKIEEDNFEQRPDIWSCHYRQRVGFLMPILQDFWWNFSLSAPAVSLNDEFGKLLNEIILPFFEEFSEPDSLLRIWKSGISPGQTDFKRLKYIDLLARVGRNN